MVYSSGLSHPSIVELARTGNAQAIAHWLNQAFLPYGFRAYVGTGKPGCLKVLVELPLPPKHQKLPQVGQDHLIRFVCHRIWQLNSARIEGVRIAARFTGESNILWESAVRVVSPARRTRQKQSSDLRQRVRNTSRRRKQIKSARSLLMGGPAVAAFMVGGVLGYAKAPVEQTNASASTQPKSGGPSTATRPKTVKTALETVAVVNHQEVQNPNDPTVTLMFAGDVTLADSFTDAMGKDYGKAFAKMQEYRQADLAMVNLENPLTRATLPTSNKQFNFKAEPESVEVLKQGGVDLVNLANNHTMDFQEAGLKETMATLDQAGILHMGAGRDIAEARRPEIVDVKGQRLAYLSYWGDEYSAEDNKAGISPILEANIAEDIRAIRNQVDWIIVNYHWGQELAEHPADWQMELARFTIDKGADLIVGHHPHVLQGAEIYRGRPIAYSLGNFIFGGNSRSDYDTAVMRVALKDKQMKVEFLPVEVKNYQPQVVGGDRGKQILQKLSNLSSDFQQPMQSSMILDTQKHPSASPATGSSQSSGTTNSTPSNEKSTDPGATTPWQQPSTPRQQREPSPPSIPPSGQPSTPTNPVPPSVNGQPSLPPDVYPGSAQPLDPGNYAPAVPVDPSGSSWPDAPPSLDQPVPWTEPAPPLSDFDSFTDSPDHTPMGSPYPGSDDSSDILNPFGEPSLEGGGTLPPLSPELDDLSRNKSENSVASARSSKQPVRSEQKSDRQQATSSAKKKDKSESVAANKSGADSDGSQSRPNIALMGPNMW